MALLLIAGIDTTWSAIGASLWHLAQTPADRERLVAEPELLPTAMEEFLRAFAPVTMARLVKDDMHWRGVDMKADDWILLSFPAANRDPAQFDRAGEVVIDREVNRHAAFGLGIHRCVGSHLARMELRVALEVWLERIPEFSLADPAGGRRGPPARSAARARSRSGSGDTWLSPDRQVSFVALGIGESPPAGRVDVANDPAAGRERGVNPGLHLVVRHIDVDVEAVAPGPRRVHLLEPERRPLAVRVQQVLVAHLGVAEHSVPERPDLGDVHGVDRYLHVHHGRRVGRRLQPRSGDRDLPGQLSVPAGEALHLGCGQPDCHALGPHINIWVVAGRGRHLADGGDQGQPSGERAGQEAGRRVPGAPQHPPVSDAGQG